MANDAFTVTVCPTDTDSYEIVHHPMYLIWCEAAIWQHICAVDLPSRNYEIVHLSCRFQSPARLHDRLTANVAAGSAKDGEPTTFRVQLTNADTGAAVMNGKFDLIFS